MQRSSARKRNARKLFGDDGYGEKTTKEPPTKTTRTTRGKTRRQKTAEELLADPDHEWYDPDSTQKVKDMFGSDEAKRIIEEKRPGLAEKHRKIVSQSGRADRAIANFQRDGRNGFYDPEWQRQAREAFRKHEAGEFDEYIKWKLYQDWPELEEIEKARAEAEAAEAEEEARDQEMGEQDVMLEDELQTDQTPKSLGSQNGEMGAQQPSPRPRSVIASQASETEVKETEVNDREVDERESIKTEANETDPPSFSTNGATTPDDFQASKTPNQDNDPNGFNGHLKVEKGDDPHPIMFSPTGRNTHPDRWYAVKSASRTPSRGNDQQNGSYEERSHEATLSNGNQAWEEKSYKQEDAMDLEDSTGELSR